MWWLVRKAGRCGEFCHKRLSKQGGHDVRFSINQDGPDPMLDCFSSIALLSVSVSSEYRGEGSTLRRWVSMGQCSGKLFRHGVIQAHSP